MTHQSIHSFIRSSTHPSIHPSMRLEPKATPTTAAGFKTAAEPAEAPAVSKPAPKPAAAAAAPKHGSIQHERAFSRPCCSLRSGGRQAERMSKGEMSAGGGQRERVGQNLWKAFPGDILSEHTVTCRSRLTPLRLGSEDQESHIVTKTLEAYFLRLSREFWGAQGRGRQKALRTRGNVEELGSWSKVP